MRQCVSMASVWRLCRLRTEALGEVEARDDDDPVEEAALDDLELARRCRERTNGVVPVTTCWMISGGFDEASSETDVSRRLVNYWCSTNPWPGRLSKGFTADLKYLDSPGGRAAKR